MCSLDTRKGLPVGSPFFFGQHYLDREKRSKKPILKLFKLIHFNILAPSMKRVILQGYFF